MADPQRRPQAVIHVDLDGLQHVYRHHGWPVPSEDPLFATGMPNLLAFLAEHDVKATLFVIASDLDDPAKRPLLEQAVAAGHEIASHSLTHPELDDLGLEERRVELAESKAKLERELGVEVHGFRAPSYQIDRDTFELLAEVGYAWDSSMYPTREFSRRLGTPSLIQAPHRPLLDVDLLELPLPDYSRVPFHPSYALLLRMGHFGRGLRRFLRTGRGAPLVWLLHLTDFADKVPASMRQGGFKGVAYTLSHRSAAAKIADVGSMLRRIRADFDVVPTETLVADARTNPARRLVLGISTTHETGAALYDGHDCLAAISEERLDRVKFSTKYPPKKAIEAVVETAGVDPRDITDVVVSGLPARRLLPRVIKNQLRDTLEYHGINDYIPHGNKLLYRVFAFVRSLGYRRVNDFLRDRYGIEPNLHFAVHHLCHGASAYRTAPFDDAIVVTADGVGDETSLTVAVGENGRLRMVHAVPYPHSFGQFYTACTQVLGFRANRHEGKITGLSGYGVEDQELYAKVKATIRQSGPDFRLDKRYYSEGIVRGFSAALIKRGGDLFEALQYRNYKAPLKRLLEGYPRENVAWVFQTLLEEELAAVVRPFVEKYGKRNLCLAGGIFANVKANAALFRALGFENVYVYPHMGDGGLGAGAALELQQAKPTPFDDVCLGPSYTDEQIEAALRDACAQEAGLQYRRADDPEAEIAALLADHKVIARFNGRMEFGPRALCNRSILYSADEPEANDWLNKRLGRTEFMPFAPVVLPEHVDKLFVNYAGTEHACKFMTIILDCTPWMQEQCPAVVHVDGTARPQFVHQHVNPSMHRILTHYHERTGIPVVVNTSFNMHEEPIVCSPQDAIRAYLASRLDYLAIGPFLAWLDPTDAPPRHEADRAHATAGARS